MSDETPEVTETPEVKEPHITVKHEVELTEEQLKTLIKKIQAAILKQAKRSRRPPEKT